MIKLNISLQGLEIGLPFSKGKASRWEKLNNKWYVIAAIGLSIFSLLAWFFYFNQDLTLSYNDARSHLNVSRRVIDSLQPGIAQIGSVWLPLYHILALPLVWNDYLWQSGLAGSVISMISYVIGGVFLIKLAEKLKFSRGAIIVSFLIYAINPNLVFMQTTPMTESLLLSLSLASVYYFVSWEKDEKLIDLLYAGVMTFMATLTRYDGWFLLAFLTLGVAYISWKKHGLRSAEGKVLLFVTLAAFGVFLWFLWNLLIFGYPFYFALGEFSAKAQQDVLEAEGRLLTKGNIFYSVFIYLFTVGYNLGGVILVLGMFGWWMMFADKKRSVESKIAISMLLSPLVFNVFSLFIGHSVIHIPKIMPFTWFNDRYGLMMLPAIAISLGYLVNKRKPAQIIAGMIVVISSVSMMATNNVITIDDGVRGASSNFLDEAGDWIHTNANEGLILVAASSNDALLFQSGLDLNRFIVEGAREYWDESIENPTTHADWVIMHRGDLVYNNLVENQYFLDNYKLVYHDEFTYIYKKELGRAEPMTLAELPR